MLEVIPPPRLPTFAVAFVAAAFLLFPSAWASVDVLMAAVSAKALLWVVPLVAPWVVAAVSSVGPPSVGTGSLLLTSVL